MTKIYSILTFVLGETVQVRRSVPVELALYLREKNAMGRRSYTDLRLLLRPYVELPSYKSLGLLTEQILPSLLPFGHGLKAGLVSYSLPLLAFVSLYCRYS